jgi:hypothetical protein
MGVLRPDNGDASPPDDGGSQHGGLPDFPPEWGAVVIPDDASELGREAALVRAELRRDIRRHRFRRAFGLPDMATHGDRHPAIGVPIVIMAVAVLTTLISLFVVTWDRRPPQPVPVTGLDDSTTLVSAGTLSPRLAEMTFRDAAGTPVTLGTLFPAVIMLVEDCDCVDLVLRTAALAPHGITVVVIGRDVPVLAGAPNKVRALADPDGLVAKRAAPSMLQTPGRPPVLFVTTSGEVAAVLPGATSIKEIATQLNLLAHATPR